MNLKKITFSFLCLLITLGAYAADDKAANKSSIVRFASATLNWYWTACEEKAKSEKILWDTSARASSRIMHMLGSHSDESVALLDHLHKTEALREIDVPGKFRLRVTHPIAQYVNGPEQKLIPVKQFMQEHTFDEYYDYLIALASSAKLTDEEKIKKEFVTTSFSKELCNSAELRKAFYIHTELGYLGHYAVNRLLLASFVHEGINLDKEGLSWHGYRLPEYA